MWEGEEGDEDEEHEGGEGREAVRPRTPQKVGLKERDKHELIIPRTERGADTASEAGRKMSNRYCKFRGGMPSNRNANS